LARFSAHCEVLTKEAVLVLLVCSWDFTERHQPGSVLFVCCDHSLPLDWLCVVLCFEVKCSESDGAFV